LRPGRCPSRFLPGISGRVAASTHLFRGILRAMWLKLQKGSDPMQAASSHRCLIAASLNTLTGQGPFGTHSSWTKRIFQRSPLRLNSPIESSSSGSVGICPGESVQDGWDVARWLGSGQVEVDGTTVKLRIEIAGRMLGIRATFDRAPVPFGMLALREWRCPRALE